MYLSPQVVKIRHCSVNGNKNWTYGWFHRLKHVSPKKSYIDSSVETYNILTLLLENMPFVAALNSTMFQFEENRKLKV